MSDIPTVANVGGDTVTYVEGGAPVRIDAGGDALVASQAGFDGATLRVEILANAAAGEDVLGIDPAQGILLQDGSIFVDGLLVGAVSGGTGAPGAALSILFNSAADSASVSRIVQALTYADSNQAAPSAATRTVSISLTDAQGAVASADAFVNVQPVNDAPLLTESSTTPATIYSEPISGTKTVAADLGVTLSDPDSAGFSTAVVRIVDNYRPGEDSLRFQVISPSQYAAFYGDIQAVDNGDGSVSLSSAGAATRIQWQNALRSVHYSNSAQDPDQSVRTIEFVINDGHDQSNALTRSLQVVANNDAPAGVDTNTTILEDSRTILSLAHFGFSDPDGDAFAGIFVDFVTQGTIWYDADGSGPGAAVAMTGYPAHFTAEDLALGRVALVPLADLSGPASVKIGFRVQDDGGTSGSGRDTDQTSNSAWFHINWVPDTADDSVELVRNSGANRLDLLANDSFENAGRAITAVGAAKHGTVTINNAGTTADKSDDYVVYTPATGYYGADSFTYTVTSAGTTETATVTINVIAAEAPVVTAPAALSLGEDMSHDFGSAFRVADVNSPSLTVSLSAARGSLTLSGTSGLTFSAGDGAGDSAMSFTGSIAAINAALQGLDYAPFADYYGADLISFSATDGTYSDSAAVGVDIVSDGLIDVLPPGWSLGEASPVNDAPSGPYRPEIAPLASGGYVLVYWDSRFSSAGSGGYPLRGQVYSADGDKIGGEFEVATVQNGNMRSYTVAGLESGGFVVFVNDYRDLSAAEPNTELYAQMFDPSGIALGGQFQVNSTLPGSQGSLSAVGLPTGGFVVAWDLWGTGPGTPAYQVKAQLFGADGQRLGGEITIPSIGSGYRNHPEIAALGDGGFVLTWMDDTGSGTDPQGGYAIFGQRFGSNGATIGDAFQVNTTTEGTQQAQSVTGLASGGFVVTWLDSGHVGLPGQLSSIRGQLYDSSGAKIGGEFLIAGPLEGGFGEPRVTALDDGGFFVAWTDRTGFGGDSSATSIHGQFYDSSGAKAGGEFLVNQNTAGDQWMPVVAGLAGGGIAIGYGDFGHDTVSTFSTIWSRILSAPKSIANADSAATMENVAIVNAGLFGNDVAPAGGTLKVATVNGSASAVGSQILLASGARLTVRADGSYDYDPAGKFNTLIAAGGPTGAVNTSATDIFSYGLVGGGTATVTITINGLASAGDRLDGGTGADSITGTGGSDLFSLRAGGDDVVNGAGGNDVFLFGAALTSADSVDGGAGTDQVAIQGDYSGGLTLGAGFTSIESFAILPGSDARFGDTAGNYYDYVLTTLDSNVAAGVMMVVDANRLRAGEDFTFNGSAESDGSFFLYGGRGSDTLLGGAKNDTFYFGEGGQFGATDHVDGGSGGTDQLGLRGSYTIAFGADQLTSIESIGLVSAQDTRFGALGSSYNYNLTMNDGNLAAGVRMTVDAAPLRPGETFTFDGSAELDGWFRIFGGQGMDSIKGGQGNDLITGGTGGDNLWGGGGNDVFIYRTVADSPGTARDTIHDFGSGDLINLSQIDAVSGGGNDAFTFIGSNAFGNHAGELRATFADGDWTVQGDVNGDGIADIEFVVSSDHPIVGTDFIL